MNGISWAGFVKERSRPLALMVELIADLGQALVEE